MLEPVPDAIVPSAVGPAPPHGVIGLIERRPGAAFGGFLALHFVVWTALPALLYANLPPDLIEALGFGPEWLLGSYKLPPLPWWLVEIVHRIFDTDAAYYALSQAAVIVAFVAVWATARPLVGAIGALIAVLIVDGMLYFHYNAVAFNHNVAQLPFWALAGYALHNALKRGRLGSWLLLGFAVGGAFWAKYFVVMLAIPYALFLLLDPQARRALATPGPWLALAVALVVMTPHLVWLFQNDFVPVQYVSSHSAPLRGWFDHILRPAVFAGYQILFLLPSIVIAAMVVWPRNKTAPGALVASGWGLGWGSRHVAQAADAFDLRIVTLLAFGPGVTMIAFTAVSGRGTYAMWGYPLWLFVGLWIVLVAGVAFDAARLRRIVGAWGAVFVVFALVFIVNYSVMPYFDHRKRASLFPGDELAVELTRRFHAATGQRLTYVVGPMWLGGNVMHYSPDHPRVLIGGQPRWTPWIDLDDLRAKGAIVVWGGPDMTRVPAAFAAVAGNAEAGTPLTLPWRRGQGEVQIAWAILKPQ